MFKLHTERLILRQWREADYAPFAALNADPEVMEFFPSPLDPAESAATADKIRGLIAGRGWGLWALERRDSGEFIGYAGLHVPEYDLPFSPCVEIGWRLARAAWGYGFATEAGRAALRHGFVDLGLEEIVSFAVLGNRRSRAVMERLGLREQPDKFFHPALPPGHPLAEHCLYRLRRSEYAA